MVKHPSVEAASKAPLNLFFTVPLNSASDVSDVSDVSDAEFTRLDDGFGPDDTLTIEIGTECFRNHDRSILLLVIFHYCNPRAADGQAGSVQSMYKAQFSAATRAVPDVCPARLEIIKVTAG